MEAGILEDATNAAKTEEFDLIVMDKDLPDGSGLDFARAAPGHSIGAPVLLWTSEESATLQDEAIAAGCRGMIT